MDVLCKEIATVAKKVIGQHLHRDLGEFLNQISRSSFIMPEEKNCSKKLISYLAANLTQNEQELAHVLAVSVKLIRRSLLKC